MTIGLTAAAQQHKSMFSSLVNEIGQMITIRQRAAVPTSGITAVTQALGTKTEASTFGATNDVKAIVSGGANIPTFQMNTLVPAALGVLQQSDVILRVRLEDVWVSSDAPFGATLFDTARDVLIGHTVFKIQTVERSGLAPLAPYIVWVGLKSGYKAT